MTIKVEKITKTEARVNITPDEIAKELIREDKKYGAASGDATRLARQAAMRKFPSLKRFNMVWVEVQPPEGKSGWGWSRPDDILRNWANDFPRPTIEGYTFNYSSPYADLPGTMILSRPSRKEKPTTLRISRSYDILELGDTTQDKVRRVKAKQKKPARRLHDAPSDTQLSRMDY